MRGSPGLPQSAPVRVRILPVPVQRAEQLCRGRTLQERNMHEAVLQRQQLSAWGAVHRWGVRGGLHFRRRLQRQRGVHQQQVQVRKLKLLPITKII